MTSPAPRRNAWDGVGTPAGRRTTSRVLAALGSVLLFLAVVTVIVYRTFLDTATFAAGVNEIRMTDTVSAAVGRELTTAILDAQPDLIAVRPLVEQVSVQIAASDLLTPLVERASAQAQRAATEEDAAAIALRLADAGAVATSALQAFAPEVAEQIPADLSLTLAEIGGRDALAGTVRTARYLSVAAWLLPVLALLTLAFAVWIAPNQRRGLVRVGLGALAAGATLAALTFVVGIVAGAQDTATLTGALVDGAWQVWSRGFWVGSAVLLVGGAVVAAAAGALLPDVDVPGLAHRAWRRLSERPSSVEGIAVRGVAISALGLGLLLQPLRLLTYAMVVLGLGVLVYGVSEVTDAAVRARRGEPEPATAGGPSGPPATPPAPPSGDTDRLPAGWALGLLAAGVAVVAAGVGAWVVQSVRTEPVSAVAASAGSGAVCNGHAELCERAYDEVAYLTTHNAMSAADAPGWFLAEQPHGITDQLDGGARALMIDVWTGVPAGDGVSSLAVDQSEGRAQLEEAFGPEVVDSALRVVEAIIGEPSGPPALYMCHGLCEIGATPLAPTLSAIRTWLDTHPDEVVTLLVENHVPASEVAAAFVEAGLEPYVLTPGEQWPTLAEMTTSGRRLVVMTEEGDGGTDNPWLRNAFELVQDTPYTFPSPDDFSCEPNRGPADAPLLLVNHWLSGFTNLVSAAETVNVADVLEPRVAQCARERGQPVIFVGVNFYSVGDAGAVVDALNGVGDASPA